MQSKYLLFCPFPLSTNFVCAFMESHKIKNPTGEWKEV